jgi:hypothetical protein
LNGAKLNGSSRTAQAYYNAQKIFMDRFLTDLTKTPSHDSQSREENSLGKSLPKQNAPDFLEHFLDSSLIEKIDLPQSQSLEHFAHYALEVRTETEASDDGKTDPTANPGLPKEKPFPHSHVVTTRLSKSLTQKNKLPPPSSLSVPQMLFEYCKSNTENLEKPVETQKPSVLPTFEINADQNTLAGAENFALFDQLFDSFEKDIRASRDRLLTLNPGKRRLIERRLEYIARKLARNRGERFTRTLSLVEVLKETFREPSLTKLPHLAWNAFVAEVSMYQVFEFFFLKSLDRNGLRAFEADDFGKLNFETNKFLTQRAIGFAYDKHCWNFARTNLYSWYLPSSKTSLECSRIFQTHLDQARLPMQVLLKVFVVHLLL